MDKVEILTEELEKLGFKYLGLAFGFRQAILFAMEKYANQRKSKKRPKIVCICGSTRFADDHAIAKWEFEKQGIMCLMISYLPHWYAQGVKLAGQDHFAEQQGKKEVLDELHLRKIDLCDEVYVVNKHGYIGESTRNEIEYASRTGKPVKYMEELK